MADSTQQRLAEVRLWGNLVGALAYDPVSTVSTFEYAPKWLEGSIEIAPLKMSLSTRKFQFPSLNSETYKGLPAVFADTLPDDFGNAVINRWLASNGRDIDSFTALDRLLYSGNRGMGALEFQPAIKTISAGSDQIEVAALVEMAQDILDKRANFSAHMTRQKTEDDAMTSLIQVGTSAGGARAKVLVAVNKDRTELRSGQVDAPRGFEQYLLK
ncbi:MAG: type II toxin-antitoxin system HipA family toxin, partial [Gammaproteobacteria bacterium]|nr:type II toxin-antitoxin system HipA family toxin [Gammaproteobacteria bacterium]